MLEKELVSKTDSGRNVHPDCILDGTFSREPLDNSVEVLEQEMVVEQEPLTAVISDGTRRSERTNRAHVRYRFPVSKSDELEIVDLDDPATFREAMDGPYSGTWPMPCAKIHLWIKAELPELESNVLMKFGFIKNVDGPCVSKKAIRCKIVFLVLNVRHWKRRPNLTLDKSLVKGVFLDEGLWRCHLYSCDQDIE